MGAACASLAARRRRSLRAARGCRPGGKGRRRVSLARRTAARPAPPRCCSLRCSRRRRRRATRALCTHRHARARAPPSRDARTLQRAARRPLPAERAPHHLLATPPLAGGTASAVAYTKMNNPRNAAIAGGFALAYFYAGRVTRGGPRFSARAAVPPPPQRAAPLCQRPPPPRAACRCARRRLLANGKLQLGYDLGTITSLALTGARARLRRALVAPLRRSPHAAAAAASRPAPPRPRRRRRTLSGWKSPPLITHACARARRPRGPAGLQHGRGLLRGARVPGRCAPRRAALPAPPAATAPPPDRACR